MKKLTLLLLFCLPYWIGYAQPHYNEWIDYQKEYFKFKVHEDGIYRINYDALQNVGLEGVQGSQFRLFYKGEEVPLYVSTNGGLSTNDYIEFFGEQNDGEFDTQLFEEHSWQLTDKSSLFTDTSRYYLTWESSNNGNRYVEAPNNIDNPPAKEKYFMHEALEVHINAFNNGEPDRFPGVNYYFADFGRGEGFSSSLIPSGFGTTKSRDYNIRTPSIYQEADAPNASFECRIAGRHDDFVLIEDQQIQVEINGQLYLDKVFRAYEVHTYQANTVFLNNVSSPTTKITYTAPGELSAEVKLSMVYTSLTYPHSYGFDNKREYHFILENSEEKYLEITDFAGGNAPVLYDLTYNKRYIPEIDNGIYKFHLPAEADVIQKRELFFINTNTTDTQPALHFIDNLTPITFTDYSQAANEGNYIIITHNKLRQGPTDQVLAYANYRRSDQGGDYGVTVVDIEELYDQFAWGIAKHPMSIRHFVDYAIDNWSLQPEYLLLLGKSINYGRTRFSPAAFGNCLVPTFGQTASDNLLTTDEIGSYVTRLAVGRISALTPEEVRSYLDKVIEHETPDDQCNRADREWARDIVHLVLGKGASQQTEFTDYVQNYENIVEGPLYGGDVIATYTTSLSLSSSTVRFPEFEQNLRDGVGLITLMGHSQEAGNWDLELQTPESYMNEGQYPFILSGSCFVGNIHNPEQDSQAEQFVLAENSGAIGFLATVSFGFPTILNTFCEELYRQFTIDSYGQPIGYCILQTLNNIYISNPNDPKFKGIRATSEEYTLEGDPAIILAGSYHQPELVIENNNLYNDVTVYSSSGNLLTGSPIVLTSTNELEFQVTVNSIGRTINGNIVIRIVRTLPDGSTVTVAEETVPAPVTAETYSILVENLDPNNTTGLNTFSIIVDPENAYTEDCEDNNTVAIGVDIQPPNCAGVPAPVIDNAIPLAHCVGDAPVALSATPTGGVWNGNGVVTANFDPSNAGDGTHLLTYTYADQATGCEVSATLSMTVTELPVASISTISAEALCIGETFEINAANVLDGVYTWDFDGGAAIGQGAGPYTVTWSNPGTKQVSFSVEKNNCASETVTVPIVIDVPLTTPNVTCNSAESSVDFSWDLVGNAESYQITINDGEPEILTAGTNFYQVSGLQIDETVQFTILAISSGPCGNSEVAGLSCTAQADCPPIGVSIDGLFDSYCVNSGELTLLGTPTGGSFTVDGETTSVFNPNQAGTYTINYTYTQGSCTYAAPARTISVLDNPTPFISSQRDFLCEGATVSLGLTQAFQSYTWSTGATTSTIQATTAQEYSVTVTNEAGCSGVQSYTLQAAPQRVVEVQASGNDTVLCAFGDQITLLASAGFDAYIWQGITSFEQTATVASPGTYTVIATDENGCQWSNSITITESEIAKPNVTVTGVGTGNTICGNQTAALSADTGYTTYLWSNGETTQTVNVGVGEYTVTVTNEDGCQEVSIATAIIDGQLAAPNILVDGVAGSTAICDGGQAVLEIEGSYQTYLWSNGATSATTTVNDIGIYFVTVTDGTGCEATNSISIVESAITTPTILINGAATATICNGELATLDAGAGYTTYLWSNGATTQTAEIDVPDIYSVTVTNADGCQAINEATVEERFIGSPTILANGATTAEACELEEVVLDAGAGYANYEWSNGETGQSITVVGASSFVVTVTDPDGCRASGSITITEKTIEAPTVSVNGDQPENILLCATEEATVDAGAGYASYEWSNGEAGQTATIVGFGEYSVLVTDEGGCQANLIFNISEASISAPNILLNGAQTTTLCQGETATLSLDDEFADYVWGDGTSGATLDVSEGGTYDVTITNANGCTTSTSLMVEVTEQLQPTILVNDEEITVVCEGGGTLDAGGGYETYEWSTGATTQTIDITEGGTYDVTVSTATGCLGNTSVTVEVSSVPDLPTELVVDRELCLGEPIELDAGEGYDSYTWSNGETTQTISVTEEAVYTVEVSVGSCTKTASVNVTDLGFDPPLAAFSTTKTSICTGSEIIFTNDSENTEVYNWTFTNETTGEEITSENKNPSIVFESAGLYTVALEVAAQCGEQTTQLVEAQYLSVGQTPDASIIDDGRVFCIGDQVTIETEGSADQYVWEFNGSQIDSTNTINYVMLADSTVLTLTSISDTICSKTENITLTLSEDCDYTLPNVITPFNTDGYNDYWYIPQALTNPNIRVEIYNRWGQQVFSVSGYNNDGGTKSFRGLSSSGNELAEGTYYYIVYINDGTEPLSGNITVLK